MGALLGLALLLPRAALPDRAGTLVEADAGLTGCLGCVSNLTSGTLEARLTRRLGRVLSAGVTAGFATGDDAERSYFLVLVGAEGRVYPLGTTQIPFDPYLGIVFGYGLADDAGPGPTRVSYRGFVVEPRLGLLFEVSRSVRLGVALARVFGFAGRECHSNPASFPVGCGSAADTGPGAFSVAVEGAYRF